MIMSATPTKLTNTISVKAGAARSITCLLISSSVTFSEAFKPISEAIVRPWVDPLLGSPVLASSIRPLLGLVSGLQLALRNHPTRIHLGIPHYANVFFNSIR